LSAADQDEAVSFAFRRSSVAIEGNKRGVSYIELTEVPGGKGSAEQLQRLFSRYRFAAQFCNRKDVLEVACGAGYLKRVALSVAGGDIDLDILRFPAEWYRGRKGIHLIASAAERLPFKDSYFDVVILYEAIYYLTQPKEFLVEAVRVLRKEGALIACTVNKDWKDFHASGHSTTYFSVPELYGLLRRKFAYVEMYGAFATNPNSMREKATSLIRRVAITLNLVPRTMRGKEFLKRIFFGRLVALPNEIEEEMCEYVTPVKISCETSNQEFKILYALARK
jgi:ubiquinone/menaquinone biosynthesis C-methylase UbiE